MLEGGEGYCCLANNGGEELVDCYVRQEVKEDGIEARRCMSVVMVMMMVAVVVVVAVVV